MSQGRADRCVLTGVLLWLSWLAGWLSSAPLACCLCSPPKTSVHLLRTAADLPLPSSSGCTLPALASLPHCPLPGRGVPPWVKVLGRPPVAREGFTVFPPACPVPYQRLVQQCLSADPKMRPAFRDIVLHVEVGSECGDRKPAGMGSSTLDRCVSG